MASFTARLRQLRTQARLSQQELADKMQVTKQTISQYERGIRKPDYDTILFFCDLFNVSADYLLGKADVTVRLLNSDELEKLSNNNGLTDEEWIVIKTFRKLNSDGKSMLLAQLRMIAKDELYIKDTAQAAG